MISSIEMVLNFAPGEHQRELNLTQQVLLYNKESSEPTPRQTVLV
jgi:hypothetical protein